MAFDFGVIGGTVIQWATSTAFWLILVVVLMITVVTALWFKKQRRFDKPVLEFYDLSDVKYNSDGKIDLTKSIGYMEFKLTKGGWFKEKFTLFGLWDYGNENVFRLKDNTPVYDVSHHDYRKINGKTGLVVYRNPNDAKIVVPISHLFVSTSSKLILAQIAPIDVRNIASSMMDEVDREMKTKWEQLMPILTAAFLGIILIFSILLITQYGKHTVDTAKEILQQAMTVIKSQSVTGGSSP